MCSAEFRGFRRKKRIPENEARQKPEYKTECTSKAARGGGPTRRGHTHKAQAGVVLWASWAAVVLVQREVSAKVWGRWSCVNLQE